MMMVRGASPESIAAFEQKWGLNDPLYLQYVRYTMNLIQGDLGNSIRFQQPVWKLVQMKIFHTLILVAPGITSAYLIGSIYGTLAGMKRGSFLEKYGSIPILFFGAFPSFVTSIFLVIIFSGWLNIFPSSGLMNVRLYNELGEVAWWRPYLSTDFLSHYALPYFAILIRYTYFPSLLMRTSVVEVADQPFMFYHKITGLSRIEYLKRLAHHSSMPLVTMYPISLTRAIGGLVLIETVFNWPGIGVTLIQSVVARDFPVMMFVFFIIASFVIIANYLVDLFYVIIDPRLDII